MPIELSVIKCPECGAEISFVENRDVFFCSYCGAKILATNENEHIYRHINEADIKRAETDQMVQLKRLEVDLKKEVLTNKIKSVLLILWIVSIVVLGIVVLYYGLTDEDEFLNGKNTYASILLFLDVTWGVYAMVSPNSRNEKQDSYKYENDEKYEGAKVPNSVGNLEHYNYSEMESILKKAGFQNIISINMHDITLVDLFNRQGMIESVEANGKTLRKGVVYEPDVLITINYHGK